MTSVAPDGDEGRIPCCAPDCRRGIGRQAWLRRFHAEPGPHAEYICQTHWSLVPKDMRRVHARIRRRERQFGVALPAGARIWRRIRIELGIDAMSADAEGTTA